MADNVADDVSIRRANADDAGLILGFIKDLAAYEKLGHEVVATEARLIETMFGPTPRAHAIIAEKAGVPVGFALYFFNYSTFLARPGLYIEDVYVMPDARGSGIGLALFAQLAGIAQAEGCGRMEWWVLDWNEPAIRFYRSLGAVAQDEWTTFRLSGEALSALAGRNRT